MADADPGAAQALAAATGAKVGALEEILASKDIDAVAICSPTDTHADLIERAAKAGKAIFCEKPVDLSADRVRACLDVVKATNAKLMIGFNRRFDPNFASLQRRIARGAIGRVEIVQITSRDPGPPPISYIARSGGLFRDMMIHDFDMARFVLGEEPVAVSAFGSSLVDPAIGEAGDVDTAVVILQTKSGKVCEISNSRRATYGYDQRRRGAWLRGHGGGEQYSRDDGRACRRARLHRRQGAELFSGALRSGVSQRTRRLRQGGEVRDRSHSRPARTGCRRCCWRMRHTSRGRRGRRSRL